MWSIRKTKSSATVSLSKRRLAPLILIAALFSAAESTPANSADFIDTAAINTTTLAPGWTGEAFIYAGDVWIRSYLNGVGQFDYRIGAGGAIAEMRAVPFGYKQLLATWFSHIKTDRVVQSTWWDSLAPNVGILVPDTVSTRDRRYNLTQGGSEDNLITPTMSVRISNSPYPQVDVYSTPQDQFIPANRPYINTKSSYFTRYRLIGEGNLMIRRVMMIGEVFKWTAIPGTEYCEDYYGDYFCTEPQGEYVSTPHVNLYVEGWTPFRVTRPSPDNGIWFNNLAFSLTANGSPYEWFRAAYNIPGYTHRPVDNSAGYAVVYNENNLANQPAVGIAFGKRQPQSYRQNSATAYGTYEINSIEQSCATNYNELCNLGGTLAVLPGLLLGQPAPRSIIDQYLVLVPKVGLDSRMYNNLQQTVDLVPAPRFFFHDNTFEGELATIVGNLKANIEPASTGIRTDHLASLVVFDDHTGNGNIYGYYHWTTGEHFFSLSPTEGTAYGFAAQGVRFKVLIDAGTGTRRLYRCYYPARGKHFVSLDPACEGAVGSNNEGAYGYVYATQVANSAPLYRFFLPANGDSLATKDFNEGAANGYQYEGLLGYVPN